jgi:hypothetical protein
LLVVALLAFGGVATAKDVSFTLEDRDRLIRLETKMEAMDKRITELRDDMNKRNSELRDDMNKRFEQQTNFLYILAGIFTAMTAANIGFAYWDRRTIIRKAKEETIAEIEKEGKLGTLVNALRELAKKDLEVEKVLRQFHLL